MWNTASGPRRLRRRGLEPKAVGRIDKTNPEIGWTMFSKVVAVDVIRRESYGVALLDPFNIEPRYCRSYEGRRHRTPEGRMPTEYGDEDH